MTTNYFYDLLRLLTCQSKQKTMLLLEKRTGVFGTFILLIHNGFQPL